MLLIDTCSWNAVVDHRSWFFHFHHPPCHRGQVYPPRVKMWMGDCFTDFTKAWSLRLLGIQITYIGTAPADEETL